MAISVNNGTHDGYVNALKEAVEEIKLRADEIIGDVGGQIRVSVAFDIEPGAISDIVVTKHLLSGYKQRMEGANNNG
jgi:hypothetical protein